MGGYAGITYRPLKAVDREFIYIYIYIYIVISPRRSPLYVLLAPFWDAAGSFFRCLDLLVALPRVLVASQGHSIEIYEIWRSFSGPNGPIFDRGASK